MKKGIVMHDNNDNNNNWSVFSYSVFLNTQRRFTNEKGIHTDSTDTQTKGTIKQHHNNRQNIKRAREGGRWQKMYVWSCMMRVLSEDVFSDLGWDTGDVVELSTGSLFGRQHHIKHRAIRSEQGGILWVRDGERSESTEIRRARHQRVDQENPPHHHRSPGEVRAADPCTTDLSVVLHEIHDHFVFLGIHNHREQNVIHQYRGITWSVLTGTKHLVGLQECCSMQPIDLNRRASWGRESWHPYWRNCSICVTTTRDPSPLSRPQWWPRRRTAQIGSGSGWANAPQGGCC